VQKKERKEGRPPPIPSRRKKMAMELEEIGRFVDHLYSKLLPAVRQDLTTLPSRITQVAEMGRLMDSSHHADKVDEQDREAATGLDMFYHRDFMTILRKETLEEKTGAFEELCVKNYQFIEEQFSSFRDQMQSCTPSVPTSWTATTYPDFSHVPKISFNSDTDAWAIGIDPTPNHNASHSGGWFCSEPFHVFPVTVTGGQETLNGLPGKSNNNDHSLPKATCREQSFARMWLGRLGSMFSKTGCLDFITRACMLNALYGQILVAEARSFGRIVMQQSQKKRSLMAQRVVELMFALCYEFQRYARLSFDDLLVTLTLLINPRSALKDDIEAHMAAKYPESGDLQSIDDEKMSLLFGIDITCQESIRHQDLQDSLLGEKPVPSFLSSPFSSSSSSSAASAAAAAASAAATSSYDSFDDSLDKFASSLSMDVVKSQGGLSYAKAAEIERDTLMTFYADNGDTKYYDMIVEKRTARRELRMKALEQDLTNCADATRTLLAAMAPEVTPNTSRVINHFIVPACTALLCTPLSNYAYNLCATPYQYRASTMTGFLHSMTIPMQRDTENTFGNQVYMVDAAELCSPRTSFAPEAGRPYVHVHPHEEEIRKWLFVAPKDTGPPLMASDTFHIVSDPGVTIVLASSACSELPLATFPFYHLPMWSRAHVDLMTLDKTVLPISNTNILSFFSQEFIANALKDTISAIGPGLLFQQSSHAEILAQSIAATVARETSERTRLSPQQIQQVLARTLALFDLLKNEQNAQQIANLGMCLSQDAQVHGRFSVPFESVAKCPSSSCTGILDVVSTVKTNVSLVDFLIQNNASIYGSAYIFDKTVCDMYNYTERMCYPRKPQFLEHIVKWWGNNILKYGYRVLAYECSHVMFCDRDSINHIEEIVRKNHPLRYSYIQEYFNLDILESTVVSWLGGSYIVDTTTNSSSHAQTQAIFISNFVLIIYWSLLGFIIPTRYYDMTQAPELSNMFGPVPFAPVVYPALPPDTARKHQSEDGHIVEYASTLATGILIGDGDGKILKPDRNVLQYFVLGTHEDCIVQETPYHISPSLPPFSPQDEGLEDSVADKYHSGISPRPFLYFSNVYAFPSIWGIGALFDVVNDEDRTLITQKESTQSIQAIIEIMSGDGDSDGIKLGSPDEDSIVLFGDRSYSLYHFLFDDNTETYPSDITEFMKHVKTKVMEGLEQLRWIPSDRHRRNPGENLDFIFPSMLPAPQSNNVLFDPTLQIPFPTDAFFHIVARAIAPKVTNFFSVYGQHALLGFLSVNIVSPMVNESIVATFLHNLERRLLYPYPSTVSSSSSSSSSLESSSSLSLVHISTYDPSMYARFGYHKGDPEFKAGGIVSILWMLCILLTSLDDDVEDFFHIFSKLRRKDPVSQVTPLWARLCSGMDIQHPDSIGSQAECLQRSLRVVTSVAKAWMSNTTKPSQHIQHQHGKELQVFALLPLFPIPPSSPPFSSLSSPPLASPRYSPICYDEITDNEIAKKIASTGVTRNTNFPPHDIQVLCRGDRYLVGSMLHSSYTSAVENSAWKHAQTMFDKSSVLSILGVLSSIVTVLADYRHLSQNDTLTAVINTVVSMFRTCIAYQAKTPTWYPQIERVLCQMETMHPITENLVESWLEDLRNCIQTIHTDLARSNP
jgi:hypothetical protein